MFIKICGITSPETACRVLELGADCIGLVYFPKSPRHVNEPVIERILDAAEPFRQQGRKTALVVVDSLPQTIDKRFDFIQPHGSLEPFQNSADNERLNGLARIPAVKDLQTIEHLLRDSDFSQTPTAPTELPQYLLEMSSGTLPGGNGVSWDWASAKPFCKKFRTILAGGLNADNVLQALEITEPFGIDVSSGVESSPGIKDFDKVKILIDKVRAVAVGG